MALVRWIGFWLILALLGCGGGGGDGTTGSPPTALFSVSATEGAPPLIVRFDASQATDADGRIVRYDWVFGDGSTGIGAAVAHTYASSGDYTAILTVTDDDGLSGTANRRIRVEQTFRISGTVTSPGYAISDSDVNDENAIPIGNDSFDAAQTISTPATVSGYVNVAGAGESGNSSIDGDPDDYFRAALTAGTTITLVMTEDPSVADLNLYLYDDDRTQIDASLTPGEPTDSLTVPADGTYYLRVEAVADATLRTATVYSLNVGQAGTAGAGSASALRLSDDFVPGEILVRFEEPAHTAAAMGLAGNADRVAAMGFRARTAARGRERLLRRDGATDRNTVLENLGIKQAFERSVAPGRMDSTTRAKMETLWMVRALGRQSGVQLAEPNYIRKPLLTPNDPYAGYQWHYPLINLNSAWDITTGSSDVVVAVIDTGVLAGHPDLAGQLVAGYDFISDTDTSRDGDGVDADPEDPGDRNNLDGTSSFHGTHVAGTIAAAANNSVGVAGIAWDARVMPLRVLGYGGGTSYDILQAVKYAAGLETDYDGVRLSGPVDIINLSLGGTSRSAIEQAVFQQARDQGVIIIAAAGNSGTSEKMYPAAYAGVVSVSAVTIEEAPASYSNYGDSIDVAAPGGSFTDTNGDGYADGVLSTSGNDDSPAGDITMEYAFSIGTSMAAPHVAGVAALMKSIYPALTPDEFDALLQGGYLTRDLGDAGWDDRFGWGLIDAYIAVLTAQQGAVSGTIPAILSASPSILNFGNGINGIDVVVENSGNAEASLTVTGTSTNAAWLSVAALDVDASGLGTYTVSVDRQGLADGTYSGSVLFASDSNQAVIRVSMRVGDTSAASDGGYHYILLLDPDTGETRQQVGSKGADGIYAYAFSGLSSGDRVVVYAGTDPDNDGYICDAGESCGAYLSLDQPAVITVTSDISGIDFTTDVNLSLSTSALSIAPVFPLQRDLPKAVLR